ncbi:MAG: thioredoxin domain-containing protein [Thermoplasmatota archaeon]
MDSEGPTSPSRRNALAKARSAYLRSAQDQPIDWMEWGPEAFARAKRENKPILLDIGAVWCHWCHVMDHESYESAATAAIINRRFVAVKVDRDERPDVDRRFQSAVQTLTGSGGWPLTAFLTPDGSFFYGGTYFPPEDAHGRPGFPRVLEAVADLYEEDREKAVEQAQSIRDHMSHHAPPAGAPGRVTDAIPQEAANHALAMVDMTYGGFGGAPKFPHTGGVDLLIRREARTNSASMQAAIETTLEGMARGGVFDQIGGGFHRYSTDARWLIPHFEKMLYDNAGLLANYTHAYQRWQGRRDEIIIQETIRFLREVLEQPGGGFGGSQDADVGPHDDGDFFTWSERELADVLEPAELRVFATAFGLRSGERGIVPGAMPHNPDRHVLYQAADADAIASATHADRSEIERQLASAIAKVRIARGHRRSPFVDSAIYVNWNAMAIAALLEAAGALAPPSSREGEAAARGASNDRDGRIAAEADSAAFAALDRIVRDCYVPKTGFAHTPGGAHIGYFLDDQAEAGWALTEAFVASGDERWLAIARDQADIIPRFRKDGTYLDKIGGEGLGELAASPADASDAPTPAGIAVAARFFLRMAAIDEAHASTYRDRADEILRAYAPQALRLGLFGATFALAVDESLEPPPVIKLVGSPSSVAALRVAARRAYAPGRVILHFASLEGVPAGSAVVCVGERCLAPTSGPADLEAQIASALEPAPHS